MTNSAIHPSTLTTSQAHSGLAFALGIYFSLLQFSYFFLMEAYVSSRSISFFFVLFFWLIGFIAGLRINRSQWMLALIILSISSYYLTWLAVRQNPYSYNNFITVSIATALSGAAPGYYFTWAKNRFPKIKNLFFHENNGFIIGIILSLFGSLFAGAWLLNWAALLALIPVTLIAIQINRTKKLSTTNENNKNNVTSPLFPYLQGFHFGTLQVALYLTVQVYYSASYMSYFLIVLAWMAGVILGLKGMKHWKLHQAGYLSLGAYLFLLLILSLLAPYTLLTPIIALFTLCIALPVGILFRQWIKKLSATTLFLHENNGFIGGYLVSTLSFVQWGIHFLYWGPLLSFALTQMVNHNDKHHNSSRNNIIILAFFPAAAMASYFTGGAWVALSLFIVGILGITSIPKEHPINTSLTANNVSWHIFSTRDMKYILVLAGLCLLLLQYLITREFSAILAASELSILIIALAYLIGLSVGYGVLRGCSLKRLQPIAIIMFLSHLLILPIIKPLSGLLISFGWGHEVLWGLLFVTAFFTSAFYAIFLPRLIEAQRGTPLVNAYSWDLLGAATAIFFMLLLTHWWPSAIWPLYLLGMVILTTLLLKTTSYARAFLATSFVFISLFSLYQNDIFTATTEDYYRSRGYEHPKLLLSQHSHYHSLDIIESYQNAKQTQLLSRSSFLNGVGYFRQKFSPNNNQPLETGLSEFTYFLAELPAKFLAERQHKKLRILILGAGSMSSMKRVRPYSLKTTLVELDSLVVKAGKKYWADVNSLTSSTQANEEIIIDDAKHYLMVSQEKFDLIIMDISAPYYLGTMLLHNREFFRLIHSRLKPKGLFAESTQSRPRPTSYKSTAMRILSAVDDVFPYWNLISTKGSSRGNHGYIYAFRRDLTSSKTLIKHLKQDGYRSGSRVYSHNTKRFKLQHVHPFSLTNMDSLLTSNRERINRRLKLNKTINSDQQWTVIDLSISKKLNSIIRSFSFWLYLLIFSVLSWWLTKPLKS